MVICNYPKHILLYKAEKSSVCLSVCPSSFLAYRYLSSVSIDQNKTCSKSKLCPWGSQSLFLQVYRTHHSSTGVCKRLKFKQPLTIKHEAGGSSPTPHVFLFQLNVFFIVHHHSANSEPQLNTVCINQNGAFQFEIKP